MTVIAYHFWSPTCQPCKVIKPAIEDLKEEHDCWESCGIVEVRVEYVRTIVEQNLNLEKLDDRYDKG